jgi:hypothetical protein
MTHLLHRREWLWEHLNGVQPTHSSGSNISLLKQTPEQPDYNLPWA